MIRCLTLYDLGVQLSKVIKHLQAQLDHQEAAGASLEGQLATALRELERLQTFEANQQAVLEQVCTCYSCRTVCMAGGAAQEPAACFIRVSTQCF